MSAKMGLLHDYDLMANAEQSAHGNTCVVCAAYPVRYQWSDYSGEGMCTRCGTPYQLKWGGKTKEAEGKYPYLNLREDFLPIARDYWKETQSFVHYGQSFSQDQGIAALNAWIKQRHPELLKDDTK